MGGSGHHFHPRAGNHLLNFGDDLGREDRVLFADDQQGGYRPPDKILSLRAVFQPEPGYDSVLAPGRVQAADLLVKEGQRVVLLDEAGRQRPGRAIRRWSGVLQSRQGPFGGHAARGVAQDQARCALRVGQGKP